MEDQEIDRGIATDKELGKNPKKQELFCRRVPSSFGSVPVPLLLEVQVGGNKIRQVFGIGCGRPEVKHVIRLGEPQSAR
jgi:hypothetical protein